MPAGWNISLFTIASGAAYGRILVGLQKRRPASATTFARFLDELAYPYVDETENPVYRLFLQ